MDAINLFISRMSSSQNPNPKLEEPGKQAANTRFRHLIRKSNKDSDRREEERMRDGM